MCTDLTNIFLETLEGNLAKFYGWKQLHCLRPKYWRQSGLQRIEELCDGDGMDRRNYCTLHSIRTLVQDEVTNSLSKITCLDSYKTTEPVSFLEETYTT